VSPFARSLTAFLSGRSLETEKVFLETAGIIRIRHLEAAKAVSLPVFSLAKLQSTHLGLLTSAWRNHNDRP